MLNAEVVNGLEIRRTARYRGFESHPLRQIHGLDATNFAASGCPQPSEVATIPLWPRLRNTQLQPAIPQFFHSIRHLGVCEIGPLKK